VRPAWRVSLAVALLAPAARADGVGFGGTIHGVSGQLDAGPTAMKTGDAPVILGPARLVGAGPVAGAGLTILGWVGPLRLGLDEDLFWSDRGPRLRFDSLPAGYSVSSRSSWGGHVGLFAGYQRRLGPFVPYADLRAAIVVLFSTADLSHEVQGFLNSTSYSGVRLLLGPRVGLMAPLTEHLFLDMAASAGLVGPERFGGSVGLGAWLGQP